MQEVAEQPLPKLDVDAVGRVREGIGALVLQDDIEEPDDDDADDENDQGRVAFVAQHLVDHDLEEQGRHEREHLHEERRQQHVGERFPVAPKRGQEPAKPEGLRVEAGARDLAPDEQQFGLHVGQEVVDREDLVDAGDGVDEAQAPVRESAAEHHEAALAPFGDGGRRGGGELLFGRTGRARALRPMIRLARIRSSVAASRPMIASSRCRWAGSAAIRK